MPIPLAYGPPRAGVTTLMAVGEVDKVLAGNATDDLVQKGTYVASAVYIIGWLTKNQELKNYGFGAAAALWIIQTVSGKNTGL
jgi:hypothetical protein